MTTSKEFLTPVARGWVDSTLLALIRGTTARRGRVEEIGGSSHVLRTLKELNYQTWAIDLDTYEASWAAALDTVCSGDTLFMEFVTQCVPNTAANHRLFSHISRAPGTAFYVYMEGYLVEDYPFLVDVDAVEPWQRSLWDREGILGGVPSDKVVAQLGPIKIAQF